ncbi:hypothetical protein CTAYLR_000010 [Chrysophaeum taylorii]|uniref:Serine/threonine-protein phosphatase 2A activator n=1 Tax=Chrysophaeum taylorii TaxID=2483200 RepID=A0AAD7UIB5_9STRA|nr:hypothetical protein CTAYLR_000010 [Chrysophaeum taylorii]
MVVLRAAVLKPLDHAKFLASPTKAELVEFVVALNKSCFGRRTAHGEISARIASILRGVADKVDDFPARGDNRRFGDAAFRDWHAWLVASSVTLVAPLAGDAAAAEIALYLSASFGDPQRLDYGTGHETAFVVFLLCLWRCGVLPASEVTDGAVVLVAFEAYSDACRLVQTRYALEPAGSRGVWALDDYQCLLFLFGSSQHCGAGNAPAAYVDLAGLRLLPDDDTLFAQGLRFAAACKKGAPFFESSPILFALAKKPWHLVNNHIFDYYDKEVLGNFVVARHLLFGDLFPATWLTGAGNSSSSSRRA